MRLVSNHVSARSDTSAAGSSIAPTGDRCTRRAWVWFGLHPTHTNGNDHEPELDFSDLERSRPDRDRRSLNKMGDKSEAFCRQTLNVLTQNPQVVPATLDLQEAQRDLIALDQMRSRTTRLRQLLGRAEDTETALGSDVMNASLEGYALLTVVGKGSGLEPCAATWPPASAVRPRAAKVPAPPREALNAPDGDRPSAAKALPARHFAARARLFAWRPAGRKWLLTGQERKAGLGGVGSRAQTAAGARISGKGRAFCVARKSR